MSTPPREEAPYRLEYEAFARFIKGEPLGFKTTLLLGLRSLPSLLEGLIRNIPGPLGFRLRSFYYRFRMRHLGRNVLIDVGVIFSGTANISIGDYTWIDSYCKFEAMLGEIRIGSHVHVAPFVVIGTREPVVIEDYAAVAAGARIYSNSERPHGGKRMSGPMVPEEHKAFYSAPVYVRRDAVVCTNAVLLPGAELCEGSVLGANSVLKGRLEPWVIAAGAPARAIGKRDPVDVPPF